MQCVVETTLTLETGVSIIIVYCMCSLKVECRDSVMGNFVELIV